MLTKDYSIINGVPKNIYFTTSLTYMTMNKLVISFVGHRLLAYLTISRAAGATNNRGDGHKTF